MSGKNKLTLAIVLGSVGLLLGILGTITAYNAKNAVDSDAKSTSEIQAIVESKFQEAQARQDQIEENQRSEAERFVAQLTKGEKNLLQKINGNHRKIKRLNRRTRNLRNQVNGLSNRYGELTSELAQVENDQASDYKQLNQRISAQNRQIQQLQNQMARIRGFVGN